MCNEEEFEETKGVIRIWKSTKDCQHNGKRKRTKIIYETLHIKLKIEKYKRHLKTGGEIRCSGRVSSSCSTSGTHRFTLVTNPVISP